MSTLDTITAALKSWGLNAAQIAGVEGNWQIESAGKDGQPNPAASNPKEGAIGIAQWEGGRRAKLQAFARARGTSETDLQTQLDFARSELNGPEHGALVALMQTSTAAQAATVFDQQYERSSSSSLPARVAAANALAGGGGLSGALSGAVGEVTGLGSGLSSLFGNWSTDLYGVVLKAGAGIVVGGLVVVGVYQAFSDKGTT